MSALSWSMSGALAPAAAYRCGDRVWLRVPGDTLPALVTRSSATRVQVAFYRPGLAVRALVRVRRWVGSDVLGMRYVEALIDQPRRGPR